MSDVEKWEQYDRAKGTLLDLIGYYSNAVYKEEKKPRPDLEKITQWKNDRRSVHALLKVINADDQVAIANINTTYWPVLRAFIAKE